jgi:hypothetical protein
LLVGVNLQKHPPMKHVNLLIGIAALALVNVMSFAGSTFEGELKQLQEKHEKELAAAVEPVNRHYQQDLEQLLRKASQSGDLDTAVKAKEALQSLSGNNADSAAKGVSTELMSGDFETKVLGDWILENSHGKVLYPMQIERVEPGLIRITRPGGGTAFIGEYKVDGVNLVKQARAGDPNFDMTWHFAGGHLKLKSVKNSFYNDWVLKRK